MFISVNIRRRKPSGSAPKTLLPMPKKSWNSVHFSKNREILRLNLTTYRRRIQAKCTCRRIRRRTKANANLEISEWTKMSCTTVQLQIFSVFPLTNLEKSSKIDKKSAMQKLRVFTAISQNNCIALFNLVAAAGFEPTTFGL